jgi:hypothetical protein
MDTQTVSFFDQRGNVVAKGQVAPKGQRFSGVIDLTHMAAQLRQMFEEFEELVNGQMFTLADELEDQIAAQSLTVVFDEGPGVAIEDLQIYPSTGRVSFRIVAETPLDGMPRHDGSLRA